MVKTNSISKCVRRPYFYGNKVNNKIDIDHNLIQSKERKLVTSSGVKNDRKLFSKLIMLSQEIKKPDHSVEEFNRGILVITQNLIIKTFSIEKIGKYIINSTLNLSIKKSSIYS